jgi:integrase
MGLRNGSDRAPATVFRTIEIDGQRQPPGRRLNADYRDREYLTPAEVEKLLKAARKRGRHGQRDGLMIMMAYRHGLRVSELIGLRWSQVDFTSARLTVHRLKGSTGSTHGIPGDELRELRKLRREQEEGSQFIFVTERGAPMTADGFRRMIQRAGESCDLPDLHPHMLRHSCGFALADRGKDVREIQDYLGHKNIQNTVGYTRLRPGRFDNMWE